MTDNHYEVLGVEPTASRDELRDAYRARVDALTAARDKKGITPSQLDDNRTEVARVRSAWNVLSDPFQRQRYDTSVGSDVVSDSGAVELVDDTTGSEVQLTGWRKLMAPPPPKPKPVNGSKGASAPPPRPGKEPTVVLPAGMQLAQPKARGMSLLFDVSIVLVIFYGISIFVPPLIQSDYKAIQSQSVAAAEAKNAQDDIDDAAQSRDDAQKALDDATSAGKDKDIQSAEDDLSDAESDLKSAQSDYRDAKQDYDDARTDSELGPAQLPGGDSSDKKASDKLDALAADLQQEIRGSTYIGAALALALSLLYLVPVTAMTGQTVGMRRRKIKVVRVDGSPVGWWPAFARFLVPLLFGIVGTVTVLGFFGPVVAFGIVLWGYRDANGQGIHDKLARTLVVEA